VKGYAIDEAAAQRKVRNVDERMFVLSKDSVRLRRSMYRIGRVANVIFEDLRSERGERQVQSRKE